MGAEHHDARAEPIQLSAVVDNDAYGARGNALRVVDQGTMSVARGTVSDAIDYGQQMMQAPMDEVTQQRGSQGGTVIALLRGQFQAMSTEARVRECRDAGR